MVHADLSHELLSHDLRARARRSTTAPSIIRDDRILAAAALLPLTEMNLSERFGTRHRAALGITEDTDAVAVVVSEESGQMSIVERARIVRVPTEAQLQRALVRCSRRRPRRPASPSSRPRLPRPGARPVPDPDHAGPDGDAGARDGQPRRGSDRGRPGRRRPGRTRWRPVEPGRKRSRAGRRHDRRCRRPAPAR